MGSRKNRKRRKQLQLANSSENMKKPMVTGFSAMQRRRGDDSSSSLLSTQSAPHSLSHTASTVTTNANATDDGMSSILGSLTSVTSMAYGYLMGSNTDTPGRY